MFLMQSSSFYQWNQEDYSIISCYTYKSKYNKITLDLNLFKQRDLRLTYIEFALNWHVGYFYMAKFQNKLIDKNLCFL